MVVRTCTVDGCAREHVARGFCERHYRLWRKRGSTDLLVVPTLHQRFWGRVRRSDGCWEWTGAKVAFGYGAISVDGKLCKAHRVSWELADGPIEGGLWVLHHCDNPPCVRPDHLFLGDHAANEADKKAKGRGPRGSRAGSAKLTAEQIPQIRHLAAAGTSYAKLARTFGVSDVAIRMVVLGRTWGWIGDATVLVR